jgi:HTH-type transcriptional regulator/antitoxin MqsA
MTMKCPSCGAARLVHDTRDVPYIYKGEAGVLPQVTGDFCPACGEGVFDAAQSRHTTALLSGSSIREHADLNPRIA